MKTAERAKRRAKKMDLSVCFAVHDAEYGVRLEEFYPPTSSSYFAPADDGESTPAEKVVIFEEMSDKVAGEISFDEFAKQYAAYHSMTQDDAEREIVETLHEAACSLWSRNDAV